MFDNVDDAALITAISETTRSEAAAAAMRSAMIGELVARRVGDDQDDPRAWWVCDLWDSTAAEVAAAMNISHRKASGQMRIAETLRDHLPKVLHMFQQGLITGRVISAITWRTRLVTDDEVWAKIDAALAERVLTFGPLSDEKLTAAVDAVVHRLDRDALIESRTTARSRDFTVGDFEDESGLTSVRGRLLAPDAAVLDRKLSSMIAAGVCDDDPRTHAQRRSDALGALGNGNDHLPCACGSPDCAAATNVAPKSSVVVNVIADRTAVDAAKSLNETRNSADAGTAILSGTDILPTPMLAELLRNGAKLQPLSQPCEDAEAGYRPSAKLARFVRARDLTCRFPGCTMPAEFCDIDHVIPHPIGATHPSNLACLCRKHHLLKTFWAGDWLLVLLADGTATWTSPTGHSYTTHPGCRSIFPTWDIATAELPPVPDMPPDGVDRGVKMPVRKRLRTTDRSQRIKRERAQNNADPPPFQL
ncbi:DUF222 domain-containing protein [Mycobacterium sp. B14F4]|uniref:HNH endonuclease signature motif containing protein n=1 Tax=Mycobacterium sp. B14F4 TaxID=3153565 RepID=UPI00325C86C2